MKKLHWLTAGLLLAACKQENSNDGAAPVTTNEAAPAEVTMALSRIDCGRVDVADFTGVFSYNKAYPAGPRQLASSCYLIRHGDTIMIWDTGFSIDLKGRKKDLGGFVASTGQFTWTAGIVACGFPVTTVTDRQRFVPDRA